MDGKKNGVSCPVSFWYDPAESHALQNPVLVLRDSIGALATQIVAAKYGEKLSEISHSELLDELLDTIKALQNEYHRKCYSP